MGGNAGNVFGVCDALYSVLYKHKPVDVIDFLCDEYYLGKTTNGGRSIYPVWKEAIRKIFEDDTRWIVVFTGATGLGKTTIALYCIAYILYRISLLRNPWEFFEKSDSGKFEIVFYNLTRTLSQSRGFTTLQSYLTQSPWFLKNGMLRINREGERQIDLPLFHWTLASPNSQGFGIQGGHILSGLLDEMGSSLESKGARMRVLKACSASLERFKGRFVINDKSLGRMFLVSSKQDEMSFLENYVEEMRGSKNVLVFDFPQWAVRPKSHFSGEKMQVLVGDAYTPARILESKNQATELIGQGYRVIEVPIEYKFDYERDIVTALRDTAGVTMHGVRKNKWIPSTKFITFDENKKDPISVLTVQTHLNDPNPWIGYFDVRKVRVSLDVPRYLHLDISYSGDAMALACSCCSQFIEGDVEDEDGTFRKEMLPVIETDFVLRVKAKKDERIPLNMMRKFVLDLRRLGLNIKLFTADLALLSEDTKQILEKAGIKCEYFSVDRVIQPYMDWRNLIYENRWKCHAHPILFFEMKWLEVDFERNKVDHPENVKDIEMTSNGEVRDVLMEGSKDLSDAVAGSVFKSLMAAKPQMTTADVQKLMGGLNSRNPIGNIKPEMFLDQPSDPSQRVLAGDDQVKAIRAAMRMLNKRRV